MQQALANGADSCLRPLVLGHAVHMILLSHPCGLREV